jgi:hypothetical protein
MFSNIESGLHGTNSLVKHMILKPLLKLSAILFKSMPEIHMASNISPLISKTEPVANPACFYHYPVSRDDPMHLLVMLAHILAFICLMLPRHDPMYSAQHHSTS